MDHSLRRDAGHVREPIRRDAAENRERILATARELFDCFGVESVTMRQVARSAGVGQGTLYRHYVNKGDLCMDLLAHETEGFFAGLMADIASCDDQTGIKQLDHTVTRVIEFLDLHAEQFIAYNGEFNCDKQYTRFDHPVYRRMHMLISELVAKRFVIAESDTNPVNPDLIAINLIASICPDVYLHQRRSMGLSNDDIIAGIRRIYVSGL